MFVKKDSPLFNPRRNQDHLPPATTDLNYAGKPTTDPSKIIPNNLTEMYSEMVRNVSTLEDFYGAKYVTGDKPDPGPGTVERGSHTALHVLWSIWRGLRGPKPKDFPESDWLNANFLFYDENAQLVRVKVADTLENQKMGFVWQEEQKGQGKRRRIASDRGIEVDTAKFVRFEVYINDEDDKADEIIDKAEYAGCYSQVPHKNSTKVKSKIRLGLTELLEDLDVEDDDKILVSLVPRAGGEDITIGGIKIIYAS
ncbi:UNVERIFIED_CONTAM: Polyphenol oxidase, chloroplastic [Sesamum radiatum]|uniref:Polyphenol oxidase, chloroplastic n=1 Tax=Sesamum radiatum TaxID=300843 RepID=A0AAW2KKB9_SESRA